MIFLLPNGIFDSESCLRFVIKNQKSSEKKGRTTNEK